MTASECYSIPVKDVCKFTSWDDLIHSTARTFGSNDVGASLRKRAEVLWYKELQNKYFPEVITYLNAIGITPAKHIDSKGSFT